MSTRCWVGQKRDDGYHVFYCHHDGYIKYPGVGYKLVTKYSDEDSINELIDLCYNSGTSAILDTIEQTKNEIYDSDDSSIQINVFKTIKELEEAIPFDIENIFIYIDNKWKVLRGSSLKSIVLRNNDIVFE